MAAFDATRVGLVIRLPFSAGRRARAPESYYRRRREDLTAGVAIGVALFFALAQGARSWLLIVRGVRRLDPAHGLWNFMLVIVEAATVGAVMGAAIGWLFGFAWERWHRWRRARRSLA